MRTSSTETPLSRPTVTTEPGGTDRHRRSFAGLPPLRPPFHGVRVTGALFHTQGGLVVNPGQPFGFEIDADGLRRAAARFAS